MIRHHVKKVTVFLLVLIGIAQMTPICLAAWEAGDSLAVPAAMMPEEKNPAAAFKEEVIRLVNVERTNRGFTALGTLDLLDELADIRAEESAVSFSHRRPDGTNCATIYASAYLTYAIAGENLAYGFSTPERVVNAWMRSTFHRANLLNEKFIYLGVGYHFGENGKIYCSQLFYTPDASGLAALSA